MSAAGRSEAALAGTAGILAFAGNAGGVAVLGDLPSAYRLAGLSSWVAEILRHPLAASISGFAFTLGLLAMAGWAVALGRSLGTPAGRAGAFVIAGGALLNAAGTLAPLVVAFHVGGCGPSCDAASRALLGLSLSLDAFFNLALGLGLILAAAGWSAGAGPSWLRALALVAGLASLPVAGQAVFDPAARFLAVAGPLWLAFLLATSVRWWRRGAVGDAS